MGIEPTWPAWKAGALPLSYTRLKNSGFVMPAIYTFINSLFTTPTKYTTEWWRGQDSNLRTHTRADLQSAAINHSATPPKATYL